MTKPKKATAPPSTFSSYLLVLVKVLLVVVIILLLPKLVTGSVSNNPGGKRNKRLAQQFEAMRFECERSTCKEFLPEESSMCVSSCISSTCHELIYQKNPLEDGEIDLQLARDFEKCVKDVIRTQRSKERSAKRST